MDNEAMITIPWSRYEELIRESEKNRILLNMAMADKYISREDVVLLLAGLDEMLKIEKEDE